MASQNYWKRCCIERFGWQNCQIVEHGLTWKQLFFETYLQERLEGHEAEAGDDLTDLLECVTACQDYIFTLTIRELRSHLDIEQVGPPPPPPPPPPHPPHRTPPHPPHPPFPVFLIFSPHPPLLRDF